MFKFSTTTATSKKVAQGSQVSAILQTKQYKPVERACGITTWLHKGEPSTARQSNYCEIFGGVAYGSSCWQNAVAFIKNDGSCRKTKRET